MYDAECMPKLTHNRSDQGPIDRKRGHAPDTWQNSYKTVVCN